MPSAVAGEADAGARLDRVLARLAARPRNQVQRWITDGRVTVDGRPARAATPVAPGAVVAWEPPAEPPDPGVVPERGSLAVLYEDEHVVAIDKPAGLAVHPGAGRRAGTLANLLLGRYPELAGVGGPGRPGIVHRLDKDTTGVLVVARTARAYARLSAAFAERRVGKTYVAVAWDGPRSAAGTIDLPIGRDPRDRKRMAIRPRGRPALTRYRRRAAATGVVLLELDIETGRTHQIRVHLKAAGMPLLGDALYGEARWRGLPRPLQPAARDFPRPALHARRLRLPHPGDDRPLDLAAPVPADLRHLWRALAGTDWPADV